MNRCPHTNAEIDPVAYPVIPMQKSIDAWRDDCARRAELLCMKLVVDHSLFYKAY